MLKAIRRITSAFVTIAIFSMLITAFSNVVKNKYADRKYADFFEQDADFDVLFMGTSHTLNAILPMELWNDYGIVSYNFGSQGCPFATIYWTLINSLDYTSPKLVVIDCYFLNRDTKVPTKIGNLHKALDAFPLSENKIRAVCDLLDDDFDRMEFFCGFSLYHNRWNDIEEDDFIGGLSYEKGASFLTSVAAPEKYDTVDVSKKLKNDTIGVKYLRMMIEECQKRDIEVLLTYLPFPASGINQRDANRVYDIASEYNVKYINFLAMEDIVNFDTDCYDKNQHLNLSGALKVTNYLGEYITESYDIENRSSDSKYVFWNQDYEEYTDYKAQKIMNCDNLLDYLVCLSDKSFSFVMQIDKNSKLLEDAQIDALLGNLNIDVDKLSDDADTLVIVSNGGESVEYIPCTEKLADGVDSDLGVLCLQNDDEDIEAMYLDSQQCWKLDTDTGFDIRIAVMDNRNQEIIDSADFVYESSFERKEQ